MRKDSKGNDIEVTEYIDPKTGKKVKVEKKVYKDKDGNEIIEEKIMNEDGTFSIK